MRILEKRAPVSIRVNALKSDVLSIIEVLSSEGIEGKLAKKVRYGIDIIGNPRRLTQIQKLSKLAILKCKTSILRK